MLAVVPEYVMLPDRVGTANCLIKVCVADAALFRPTALPKATNTMLPVSVNGTVIVAMFPNKDTVASVITAPSDTFFTCMAETSGSTAYVMAAVYDPALTSV